MPPCFKTPSDVKTILQADLDEKEIIKKTVEDISCQ